MSLTPPVSCAANPFTVATRFGMRSARRCSTASTSAHCPLMASRCRTRSFLALTNCPPATNASKTITPITIQAVFMCGMLFLQPVHRVDRGGDSLQIRSQQGRRVGLARLEALLADIQQSLEGERVEAEALGGALDDLALPKRRLVPMQNQRVPEKDAEGGQRIEQQAAQQAEIGRAHV